MAPRRWRIAIIGGGVAGSLAAITLAGLPQTQSIAIFDRAGAFGRGLAYSAEANWHRINVPAYKMGGLSDDDPDGFAEWLSGTGWADNLRDFSESFVPRRAYGDYIAAHLARVTDSGRASLHTVAVETIVPHGDGYRLTTADGDRQLFDLVFLCLGNPPPSPFPRIEISPRVVTDVWAPGALDPITANDRVLVIGTGATAVDVVIELTRRGIQQPIIMISRRGLLPLVDQPAQTDPDPVETWPQATTRGIFAALRAEARRKIAIGIPWQTVLDGFRQHIAGLWTDATSTEQDRFARHLRAIWLVHRHRLAPDVDRLLGELQHDGRLDVMAGRILRADATLAGHDVDLHRRGGGNVRIATNWILNCTGPEERYDRIANPLVKSLLSSGMARAGHHGLGLDVDQTCRIIDGSGRTQHGLYAVGHATRGAFWEVTAASNIRSQILAIAQALAED